MASRLSAKWRAEWRGWLVWFRGWTETSGEYCRFEGTSRSLRTRWAESLGTSGGCVSECARHLR